MAKKAINVSISGEYQDKEILRAIKDLEGLQKQSQSTARKMQDVGKKMSMALTAPLVGIGVAAAKSAMDFDDAMTKITSLVGIGADEVDGMREQVLGLAGETAKAPNELADALFVVTSAGLRGEEAMGALESAAKASAAGLGNTADIARSVAGAVNTYGTEVLDAAKATDVIVATARAGNFETSQFASALGTVLPFASAAQASLEDVGGAVALLTRTNGDASKSINSVTALLRAVATPTKQTQTQLDKLGLTTADVRDVMGEKGLVEAVRLLDERLGGNRDQLQQVLGSSEAVSAAMQILDADTETLAGTFGTVSDAAGMTDEAFDSASETAGFKFRQALQNLRATLIQFGDELTPAVAMLSNGISSIASAFGALPGPMKTVVVALGAVVAAIGPILFLGGKLLILKTTLAVRATQMAGTMRTAFMTARMGFQTMTTTMRVEMVKTQTQMGAMAAGARVMGATMIGAFRTVAAAARGLLGALGPIGVAIGLLSIGFATMQSRIQETQRFVDDFRDSLDQTTGALTEMSAAMVTKNFRLNLDEGDIDNLQDMGISVNDLTEAVLEGPDAVQDLDRELKDLSKGLNILAGPGRSLAKSRDLLARFAESSLDAGDAVLVARDDAFAAARGFDASGSSAQESVYGYDAATGGLSVLAGGYNSAGDAAMDFAVDAATAADAAAAAATAARDAAYNTVSDRVAYFSLAAAYNKNAIEARKAGNEIERTFGPNGTTDKAFDSFEDRVTEATNLAVEQMDEVVKSYYDTWQDAYTQAVEFGNDLASGLMGGLSFSTAVDAAREGGGTITDAIVEQASDIGRFGDQLIALLQTDLSQEAFEMIASMSADRGSELAAELLGANGDKLIADINTVMSALTTVVDTVGAMAAEKWYGEGVRFAQRTYEGVRDNFGKGGPAYKAVMGVMNKLAKDSARQAELEVRITKRINEEVTRVVTTISAPNAPGTVGVPAGAAGAIVKRPTFALIGEAGPEALVPLNQTQGNSPLPKGLGGGGITINVNAGMGTDGAEVGRQIVDALKSYERRNGPVYASA